ncbi:N-acetyltransferase [Eilatimonas milleporae]|uniref:N-acetyltransferase domain-containing protein n=1 Tax=Eilatimonas milleporae TaxID=911205 RepID=A0A3M0C868_9PROT|nr:N-acetyltransferase [Eilatimonas milleporae]RMB04897.1 hypothetical protein BXY39_2468 [Eilatimonas milleporae]
MSARNQSVSVRPVTGKADLKTFIRVTEQIYRDDPNWVQPLMVERLDALSPDKNPFFNHAEVTMWLAERGGRPVGRISAQIDDLAQDSWGPKLAHFGLFEAEDAEVAAALVATVEDWARSRGMTRLQGPWSLSANMEVGLLVDGFDTPPAVMMPHGRPGYDGWLKELGFAKAKDLFAYELDITGEAHDRTKRIVAAAKRNSRIHMREIDMKRFDQELAVVLDIFNDAWGENWGYVPMTEAEMKHAAAALKPVVKPHRTMICEYDGEPVAFMLTIPDINHKIRDLNGRLFPFGIVKLLARMLSRKEDRMRVPLMGVRKSFQRKPAGAAMALWMIEVSRRNVVDRGAYFGELSWILEDNDGMNKILVDIGCRVYKTYRVYEKPLAG